MFPGVRRAGPGGCSGMSQRDVLRQLDVAPTTSETVVRAPLIVWVVDPASSHTTLHGATLDFSGGLSGSPVPHSTTEHSRAPAAGPVVRVKPFARGGVPRWRSSMAYVSRQLVRNDSARARCRSECRVSQDAQVAQNLIERLRIRVTPRLWYIPQCVRALRRHRRSGVASKGFRRFKSLICQRAARRGHYLRWRHLD